MSYSRPLLVLLCTALSLSYFSNVRIFGTTIFDIVIVPTLGLLVLFTSKFKSQNSSHTSILYLGLVLFIFAALISAFQATDSNDHTLRVLKLALAFVGLLVLCMMVSKTLAADSRTILATFCVAGAIHSVVCILQGQFGILISLLTQSGPIEIWTRFTGLAEHPIEAGYISAYSSVCALALIRNGRTAAFYSALIAVNLFSMKYSGSFTAMLGIIGGLAIATVMLRSPRIALGGLGAICVAIPLLLIFSGDNSFLAHRIEMLLEQGTQYQTLEGRISQWEFTLKEIFHDENIALFGKGYSKADLPGGEIHNGLLASLYHFGFVGLISQLVTILYFVLAAFRTPDRRIKATLFGCIVIFMAGYMTGPAFFRRSLWVPVLAIASLPALLPEKRTSKSLDAPNSLTQPQPEALEGGRDAEKPQPI